MLNLLYAMIGIALASYLLVAGAGYLQSDILERRQLTERVVSGFTQLAAGWRAYRISNEGAVPDSLEDIAPAYVDLPRAVADGFDWELIGTDTLCLVGPDDKGIIREGIKKAGDRLSVELSNNEDCAGNEPDSIALRIQLSN